MFCAVLAGSSGMSWRTFLFFNATGAVVWSVTIAVVGYALGHSWETLEQWIGRTGLLGLIVVGALIIFWIRRRSPPEST